jgi:hypothetical protein
LKRDEEKNQKIFIQAAGRGELFEAAQPGLLFYVQHGSAKDQ